jgi:hypothetical protein
MTYSNKHEHDTFKLKTRIINVIIVTEYNLYK